MKNTRYSTGIDHLHALDCELKCRFDSVERLEMKTLLAFVLTLFAAHLSAQSLINAPTPRPHLDRTEWALLASDAAARGLDVYSTHWALKAGNKEENLPGWIADHPPVMALYSGGVVAGQYYVARQLFKHGHRRWAYAITAMDIIIDAPPAIHNLFLPVTPSCHPPDVLNAGRCIFPWPD